MRSPAGSGQPKYHQLKALLVESIRRGELPDGSFLPSEDELTRLHAVSRTTVRAALKELREEGVVVTRQGQPSRVRAAALSPAPPRKIAWLDYQCVGNPLYFEIFKVVSFHAEKAGCSVNFVSVNDPGSLELFFANQASYVGGVVSNLDRTLMTESVYRRIGQLRNLFCLDHLAESPAKSFVGSDHFAGAALATQHLIDIGHRKIVFLGVAPAFYSYAPFGERLRGYRDTLRANGLAEDPALTVISTETSDFFDVRPLLEATSRRIGGMDAVFAISDHVAIDTVFALKAMSVNVPFDVSVIGFDGLWQGQSISPRLTTIRQPWEEIGRQLVELILKNGETPDCEGRRVFVAPELLLGESTRGRR